MSKLKTLRDLRGTLVKEARAVLSKAETEKRALTAEEDAKYNELFNKQDETRAGIEREEQIAEAERQSAEQTLREKDNKKDEKRETLTAEERASPRASEEYRNEQAPGARPARRPPVPGEK